MQGSNERQCYHVPQVWFLYDFIAHFLDLTRDFEKEYHVLHRGVVQKPNNWQTLVALAKRQTLRLVLRSRWHRLGYNSASSSEDEDLDHTRSGSPTVIGSYPTTNPGSDHVKPAQSSAGHEDDGTPDLKSDNSNGMRTKHHTSTARDKKKGASPKDFHLFYWLVALPPATVDSQSVKTKVAQMQGYLTKHSRLGPLAYNKCPLSNINTIQTRLAEIGRSADGKKDRMDTYERQCVDELVQEESRIRDARERTRYRGRQKSSSEEGSRRRRSPRSVSGIITKEEEEDVFFLKESRKIVRLAKQIFEFFFPLDYPSKMTGKYWGAILWLLKDQDYLKDVYYEQETDLRRIKSLVQPLARSFTQGPPPDKIDIPIEFSRAWMHIMTFWVYVRCRRSAQTLQLELDTCYRLMDSGKTKLFRSRISSPLQSYEAALPAGIVSLLVNKLVGDATSGSPDVEATYYAYMAKLKPLLSSYETDMNNTTDKCSTQNVYRIESNRDRQEGAILVFTIVTIIFLPLSFVSSFFGMNTSDIRSMDTPQWAFWASAIPLTTIVVGISIFVARKIEPVKDWWNDLADRWKSKGDVTGGFYPAPAVVNQQPMMMQRAVSGFPGPGVSGYYGGVQGRPRRRHTGREGYV
ncbi:MAG: hypothetical protein Q9170_003977 [Blastenia crenularia]